MKKLALIAALFMGLSAVAQNIKVSVEERPPHYRIPMLKWYLRENTDFQDGDNVIKIENTGLNRAQLGYTARYDKEKHALIIHKMDASGNEIATNKLENGERNFGPVPTRSIQFDGKILVFFFRYTDKDSMKLYMSELNKTSLDLTNTTYLFGYQQANSGLFKLGKEFKREIILQTSPDSTKLLLIVPGKKEEVYSCVFEKGLKMTKKKIIPVEGTDGTSISDAFMDNAGNSIAAFSEEDYTFTSFNNTTLKKLLTISPS